MTSTMVYKTETGSEPVDSRPIDSQEALSEVMWYEYCQPCGRCTDHVGEHDYLVEIGWAEYDTTGDRWEQRLVVRCTDKYDRERAGEMAELEGAYYDVFRFTDV
jgi:hypothetical protein